MRLELLKRENILCWGCCYSSLWQAFALPAGKTKQNQLGKQPFQLGQDSIILRVHEYISASVDSSSIVAMCDAQFVYLLTKVMKE